ncbi:MAG: hypothetical protein AMXMBFR45_01390 [Gammaproteobacteria bacterium]|nr:MAG: hypothetical protein BroJett010_24040 [Gammaproteobacteria bacterium]
MLTEERIIGAAIRQRARSPYAAGSGTLVTTPAERDLGHGVGCESRWRRNRARPGQSKKARGAGRHARDAKAFPGHGQLWPGREKADLSGCREPVNLG